MMRVISLGAGVQSTALCLMAAEGMLPHMPDCAIFADTQAEPKAVYDNLKWLMEPGRLPFPVHVVTAGDLWASATRVRRRADGAKSYIATGIPVFTLEGLRRGKGNRQCTRTFKIEPVNQQIQKLLGIRRITKKYGVLAEVWIGISTDEAQRIKPNRKPWLSSAWPLIDLGFSREDCLQWMRDRGHPEPPRSACTFCPFRDDQSWLALTSDEFGDAVVKEGQLQEAYRATNTLTGTPYLHASRVPLDKVEFLVEEKTGRAALNKFKNECEGMCGV